MASEPILSRSSRPSKVQTNLGLQAQAIAVCGSAVTSPPESPESQNSSPLMCAEPEELTASASLRGSSDDLVPLASRSLEDLDVSDLPFKLQEAAITPSASTLSRRTSTASLTPATLKSPGTSAMGEVMKGLSSLSRRSSNSFRRVNSIVARRPSSSHPRSRDGSVGPGVMRRRGSTSNPSLPLDQNAFYTDSDEDCAIEKDDSGSLFGDGQSSNLGTSASSTASTSAVTTGPVIPEAMLNGTAMTKVGKRKTLKRITLCYDPKAVKIFWDRNKSSKAIYIDDIKEILTAEDIGQYRLDSGLDESSASRFFSILYTRQGQAATRTLHLVTDDTDALTIWTDTLEDICKRRQAFATSLMAFDDRALKKWWLNETTKLLGNDKFRPLGVLKTDSLGIEHVCRSLHIHIPAQELRARIEAVKGQKGIFDRLVFSEFLEFVRHLKSRKDINSVYRQVAESPEKGVSKDEFFRFLRDVQHENVDENLAYWENIFVFYVRKGRPRDAEKILGIEDGLAMSEAGFSSFLTSLSNSPILKEPLHSYTLDRPMTEYYISSSHNTYLLGRQVKGVSSTEGYVSALGRGCRCIEIDCWDGPNDEPIVMHGRSWTTRISFSEVIKTINKHAFAKSRFPLWISLEVRCNFATQANMAKMMIDAFGDKLVREPISKNPDRLPSPSDLLGRILIKVKQSQIVEPLRRRGNSQPSPYQRPLALDNAPIPSSPLLSPTPFSRSNRQVNTPNTITEGEVHDVPSSSPSECESDSDKDSSSRKSASKINPVLGELGVYCVGIQFEGFDTPEAKKYNHIFSFKEKTFAEKSQPGEPKRQLYCHNMRYMMRVYPNGSRISSSNFDPLIYWKRGVQMAALNWQTFDTGMQINQAMFDGGTDQSGYVLKPIEGREFKLMPELLPSEIVGKRPRKHVSFTVNVISAQQLMKPFNLGDRRAMDPYVEVEVLLADDKRNKGEAVANGQAPELKFRTKIARENGFNPSFGDACEFNITTKYPDLIFVRFNVKLADRSYNDRPPMATFTAKLNSLNQGYRTIPLHNQWGERFMFSTLFCHIKKERLTDIMIDYSEDTPRNGNKLNRIGKVVRSAPSPKTSIESSRSS
ncbi:hypothetical protein B0T16DRAFT_320685 [Cercophora newfieldiana]|uniref:Phosphoinositide phospholipase C n=1 Tax=Cercophora newfieldiana TaxID=92897 RepID=A0AA40CW66_9PEZI|nr:hypothetical protein B0T16DRAFT_320685 [Cercophora newfieldiana]